MTNEAFLAAFKAAARNREFSSQGAFGKAVADEEGRARPYHQTVVSQWINGGAVPGPDALFAIERVLDVPPGSLSIHLGYLPPYAQGEVLTVPDAIDADPNLTPASRRMLKAAYAAAVGE